MSSHPIVRRLTAAALLLVLAAAPALAAPANRPHPPRLPVVASVPLLDQLLDWLGFPTTGDRPDVRGAQDKSGTGLLPLDPRGLLDRLLENEEHGGMIDPNG